MFKMKYKKTIIIFFSVCLLALLIISCKQEPKEGETFVLDTPKNLKIENEYLSWDPVENAKEYVVIEGKDEYRTSAPKFDILELAGTPDHLYSFQVYAVGDYQTYLESENSEPITYQFAPFDSWKYELWGDESGYQISIADASKINGKIIVPSEYEGKPVVRANLQGCDALVSVILPDTVQVFSFAACKSLTRVKLPSTLKMFHRSAVAGCESLTELRLPNTIEIVYSSTTGHDKLTDLSMEEGGAYYRSEGNCIIRIADDTVVYGCMGSRIPQNVKAIGEFAFSSQDIESIVIPHGVLSIDERAFFKCKLKEIRIPASVETIEAFAFYSCEQLADVAFSEGLKTIGENAFSDCPKLLQIRLPASLTAFEMPNFKTCTKIDIAAENDVYQMVGNSIIEKREKTLVLANRYEATIPQGVVHIGPHAFSQAQIKSVEIPEGVVSIGEDAFYQSTVSSVSFPSTLQSIGSGAFEKCKNLSIISLPNGKVQIDSGAIGGGFALSAVILGEGCFIYKDAICESFVSILLPYNTTKVGIMPGYSTFYSDITVEGLSVWPKGFDPSIAMRSYFRKCVYGKDGNIPYVDSIRSEWDDAGKSSTIRIYYGENMLAPYREGYTFAGWSTEPDGEILIAPQEMEVEMLDKTIKKILVCMTQEQLESLKPLGDITLYAVWVKNA